LRKTIFSRNLRYKKNVREITGKPDIVFSKYRLCVFVDGDFWHGREWKRRGFGSLKDAFKRNQKFWVKKISSNVERDKKVNKQLKEEGWNVLRVWESDILADVNLVADKVEKKLDELRHHD
jgi:DNA mismatch endonuclease (patch repair protein)